MPDPGLNEACVEAGYKPQVSFKKGLLDALVVTAAVVFADQNILGALTGLVPHEQRLFVAPVLVGLWTAGQNFTKNYKR